MADSFNLETEYQDLIKDVYGKIDSVQDAGLYTSNQAAELYQLIEIRTGVKHDTTGSFPDHWKQSSSSCYDEDWESSRKCW